MYSGTTLTKYSGRLLGAHQKIDRAARRNLDDLLASHVAFPSYSAILQFEGKNGPDAIKRKSPAVDEPWHYFSPFDDDDSQLIGLITDHYTNLVRELRAKNQERVAFEAAWLAHALVDGLTPAHHYPYEEKLEELRGEGIETRTTYKEKLVMPGETRRKQAHNNWLMWGPKGLLMAHIWFELGVAAIIKPLSFKDAQPSPEELHQAQEVGVAELFKRAAREIAVMDLYSRYQRHGWTPKMVRQVRKNLSPTIVKTVTIVWYCALVDAGLMRGKAAKK